MDKNTENDMEAGIIWELYEHEAIVSATLQTPNFNSISMWKQRRVLVMIKHPC